MNKIKGFFVNNKKSLRICLICLLYMILLVPYVLTILNALPYSDDFCMIISNGTGNLFIDSISATINTWLTWSGEFLYFFLQYFLNPLAYAPVGSRLFGVVLAIIFLLFIISFSYFNFSWLQKFFGFSDKFFLHLVNIMLISVLLFANNYHEIFYWFVGSSYMWEYSFAFISIGSMIRYFSEENGGKKYYILLIVFGMISCNAVNMCVNIGFTYLVLAYWYITRENRKICGKFITPIMLFVLTGIITVFSPGNFSRRGEAGGGSGIVKAFLRSISSNIRRVFYLFENESVFFLMLCIFVLGLIVNSILKKQVMKLWVILLIMCICLVGTLFPVAAGYGDKPMMSNRICYVVDMVSIPCLEIFFFYLGMNLSYKFDISFMKKDFIIVGMFMVTAFYAIMIKDYGYASCEYINQVSNYGKTKQERALWVDIYNDIYNSSDKDVTITIPDDRVVISGVLENPNLNEEPEFWINSEIRRYFRKNSISVILNEIAAY